MLALRSLVYAAVKTRLFFRPFELRKYAAAASVTAFVGLRAGYGSVTNLGALALLDRGANTPEPLAGTVAESVDLFAVGALAVLSAALVGAVAEYVLVDLLRTDEIHVRRYARDRLGHGGRLFVFRFAATAILFAFAGAAGYALVTAPVSAGFVALFAVLGVLVSLANGFTTDFVVPVVVVRDCKLLGGWRVVARLVARRPRSFAGYAVVRVVANVAVAVVATVAAGLVAALFALPLAVSSYALGLTSGGFDALIASAAGFVLLIVVVVVYLALVLASVAVLVQLPVRLFFRSWSLYFLGEVDEEYALLDEPETAPEPLSTYLSGMYGGTGR